MSAPEPHVISREGWPPGPWDDEPDRVEWRHEGVPCLAVRNRWGAWCGYAAVEPGHPFHGRDGSDGSLDLDVHGGITYSDACAGPICHVPEPGEPDNVWWLGFDCSHAWDYAPGLGRVRDAGSIAMGPSSLGEVYRTLEYVRRETEKLADQLRAAGGAS